MFRSVLAVSSGSPISSMRTFCSARSSAARAASPEAETIFDWKSRLAMMAFLSPDSRSSSVYYSATGSMARSNSPRASIP